MLGVKSKFPEFNLKSVVGTDLKNNFEMVNSSSYPGKWIMFFFWPKDFTFVCPTEIIAFSEAQSEFDALGTQILGASVDSEFVHLAWKNKDKKIGDIKFPMLSDINRTLSSELGILDPDEGVSQRAVYIIDPNMVIRYVSVYDLNVGRNVKEILRTLTALQNGGLCPIHWEQGDKTIELP